MAADLGHGNNMLYAVAARDAGRAAAFAGFAVRLDDGRYAATPRALRLSLVPNIEEGPK